MIDVLFLLNKELSNLGIDYEYEQRTSQNSYPYFVGEAEIIDNNPEYGGTEGIITLYGFNLNDSLPLYETNEKIKNYFENYLSITDGKAISIEYNSMLPVTDTGNPKLKRIDITLDWKVWKGK